MTASTDADGRSGLLPEEKEFLRRDAFIAAVLKQRGTDRTEPWWRYFLASPGGTALITVLFGGVAAAWITAVYQAREKERDLQHAASQIKTALIDEVLSITGKVRGNAESRIEIDGPKYARRLDPGAERVNAAQKLSIRQAFNQAWQEWDMKKLSMLARIRFNFGAEPADRWAKLIVATDRLLECASGHIPNPTGENLCRGELENTTRSAEDFVLALEKLR